jgi:beta-lactamase class C
VRAYANPSAGPLGVAAARALKGDFAALVREKVIAPLGLAHTFYDVPDAEQAHYAQGHARDGRPVRLSRAPLWREAYGVRTTAGDLLRYVEAQLGLHDTDPALRRALAATHVGQVRAGPMTQALIWEWYPYPVSAEDFAVGHADAMVFRPNPVTRLDPPRAPPADAVVDKTGGTSGFGAYAAFIPPHRPRHPRQPQPPDPATRGPRRTHLRRTRCAGRRRRAVRGGQGQELQDGLCHVLISIAQFSNLLGKIELCCDLLG